MLNKTESNNSFDLTFLDLWELGYIPDLYRYLKIMKLLDCIEVFDLGEFSVWKKIT